MNLSIQITSEIESNEESISNMHIQEPEDEKLNQLQSLVRINGIVKRETAFTIEVGDTVSFGATNSYDADGSIVSYKWIINGGLNSEEYNQENLDYLENEGNYEVTLRVTDNDGETTLSGTQFIFVNAKANTGGNEDNGNSTLLIGGSLAEF